MPKYIRTCTICGVDFFTDIKSKNNCSFKCRREHVRVNNLALSRIKRKLKPVRYCVVCNFSMTTDLHREDGKEYILCPNHHCLITRNIMTTEEVLKLKEQRK